MKKFIILIKLIISSYTIINVFLSVSEAAGAGLPAPLRHDRPANLIATAPFSYNSPAPINAIQRLAQIASHPNSLRDAVLAAFERLIPPIVDLPATPTITIEGINTKVQTTTTEISQRMVTQLAAILSPDWVTAKDAIMNSDSTVTEAEAQGNFNNFQTMCAMSPADAAAPPPPLIFVPTPANPGLQKCNTKHVDMQTLEQIVTVIRKAYYNLENLGNLATHVNDRHIGPTARIPDPNASRFNAENVHAAMHYIRFVLNLILPENINLNIIRKYSATETLLENVVYIKYQRDSAYPIKCDITIYYKFSYGIGRERTGRLTPLKTIRIGLGNYTTNVLSVLVAAPWHIKTAFPAAS